jgi:hypothetical protein
MPRGGAHGADEFGTARLDVGGASNSFVIMLPWSMGLTAVLESILFLGSGRTMICKFVCE